MIKEFKPIKRPFLPMPLDVKIEMSNLRHEGYNAEFVYNECKKLVKTGISVSSLYYLRDGKLKKPSFELMCKIADALGVSLDYFREMEDDK